MACPAPVDASALRRANRLGTTLVALALLLPHAGVAVVGVRITALALIAVAVLGWERLMPRDMVWESMAYAAVLAAAFFGARYGAGLPNAAVGPLVLLLAALASAHTLRGPWAGSVEAPGPLRWAGFVFLVAWMWAFILVALVLAP